MQIQYRIRIFPAASALVAPPASCTARPPAPKLPKLLCRSLRSRRDILRLPPALPITCTLAKGDQPCMMISLPSQADALGRGQARLPILTNSLRRRAISPCTACASVGRYCLHPDRQLPRGPTAPVVPARLRLADGLANALRTSASGSVGFAGKKSAELLHMNGVGRPPACAHQPMASGLFRRA